jgi:hypothetical protein
MILEPKHKTFKGSVQIKETVKTINYKAAYVQNYITLTLIRAAI